MGHAERTTDKVEFMHDGHEFQSLHLSDTGEDRILLFGLQAAVAQAIAIFLRIAELQRILSDLRLRQRVELAIVEEIGQPRLGLSIFM